MGDTVHHFKRRVILSSLGAMACIAAGCGSPSEDSASPSTLPFDEITTTLADEPPTSSARDAAVATPPELTAEMFESMLETESGRELLVSGIASEADLDLEAAGCLLDAMPVELLVEAAGSFLGGDGEGALFSFEQMTEIAPLLESCDIDPESLLP